ncbi:MAG: lanthionine synthetase C family protein [Dysgonamonadaceae bacterium]|jgi:lantibiotic modifying enzyme|nr:lanthionine synthetase C family protein [Dysgonamonadaceae bacterium]
MDTVIKQKIDSIANCIVDKVYAQQAGESYGLYSGEWGILLFLFYYSKYSENKQYAELAESFAETLFAQFPEKLESHTFCNGLSGVLYLFEFLRENQFIDISAGQSNVNDYLVFKMRQDIRQQHYDFMHGALGVGLYFLKKKTNTKYVQELVDFLYNTAEKDTDNQIFKWKSVIDIKENITGYNIALSHGISSIIIFLSRVIKSDMTDKKVHEMLVGAVNYVLSQQLDVLQFGANFPQCSVEGNNFPIKKSRLAWCYGDLGIGIALWQAGKAINKIEWGNKGLAVLLQTTQRLSLPETYVQEAGICHGSAGIAMIYYRMFLETQRDEFNKTTQYWMKQTLNFAQFEDGLAGYKALTEDGWKCNYSLLTGISGIGLVLMSFVANTQQKWDELFLLL